MCIRDRTLPIQPVLALPVGQQDIRLLPTQVLADLAPALPTRPTPVWLTAWLGETPATRPDLAAHFSLQRPDAYRAWLAAQLPVGCHIRQVWATVTAYCPCAICCSERTERTALGRDTGVYPYGVAADWRQVRPGTKVHVPGYLTQSTIAGVWNVDDTGAAMRHSYEDHARMHLDVRFQSHEWAMRWGTRHQWVYLIEPAAATQLPESDPPNR